MRETFLDCEFQGCHWKSEKSQLEICLRLLEIHVAANHPPSPDSKKCASCQTNLTSIENDASTTSDLEEVAIKKDLVVEQVCSQAGQYIPLPVKSPDEPVTRPPDQVTIQVKPVTATSLKSPKSTPFLPKVKTLQTQVPNNLQESLSVEEYSPLSGADGVSIGGGQWIHPAS